MLKPLMSEELAESMREPVVPGSPQHRARIIENLRALAGRINALFVDAAAWNASRAPGEAPVEADPDGELTRLRTAIAELLDNDPGFGQIAPLNFAPGQPS